jgi:hypothetical protein
MGLPRTLVFTLVLLAAADAAAARSAHDAARAWVAARPAALAGVDPAELQPTRERALPGGGALVVLERRAGGVRVVGGGAVVRVDGAGQVRWAATAARPLPPGFDLTPALPAALAVQRARAAAITAGDARSELVVWWPDAAPPRLAWIVETAGDARALVPATRIVIDARRGRVIALEPMVAETGQATVFEVSPSVTPMPLQVDLSPALDPGATFLDSADFQGFSCIDDGTCIMVNVNGTPTPIHACGFTRRAAVDPMTGDFLYTRPMADTDQTDPFAEVQIFYHSTRAIAFFRALGLTDLSQKPMRAVANVLIADYADLAGAICSGDPPAPPAGEALVPLQNAAFFRAAPMGLFPPEDMMIFGQGKKVDFAYDGDVVYHELGHALHFAVAPEYGRAVRDARGLDLTPHGTYEGYADYFAFALTEDPELGEYTGIEFNAPIGAGLRTATNSKRCPDDLWGEEHQDGEPWVGALWDVRTALAPGDRPAFDAAVFTVVSALGAGDTPIGDTPALLALEVEMRLGAAARTLVEQKLAARGWDDCDDRVVPIAPDARRDLLFVRGSNYLGEQTQVPTIVQFRIEVASPSQAITVSWQNSGPLGGLIPQVPVPPEVTLLVKRDTPITWTWDENGSHHDADASGTIDVGAGGLGSGMVTGDFAPGTYHVQLANAGGSIFMAGLGFGAVPAPPAPDAGPTPDAMTPPGGDDEGDGGGCGCRAGGQGGRARGGLVLALVALAALLATAAPRARG